MYNAIMKAADQIKQHPDLFGFSNISIPSDCGALGCALGWIGYFCGARTFDNACTAMGIPMNGENHGVFYTRMNELGTNWKWDADICAKTLRLYAEKYHGEKISYDGNKIVSWENSAWRPEVCTV